MNCIMLSPDGQIGREWLYGIENLGEEWRCTRVLHGGQALHCLEQWTDVLILADCRESRELLRSLTVVPLLAPPYILGLGWNAPDGTLHAPGELPACLSAMRREGRLPALAGWYVPRVMGVAAALMRSLAVPRRLRAWEYLPEMAALTVVHPPLLSDLRHGLYPLMGRRHGMTATAVERSLRLCVESTWMHGSIDALERFFGSSVDPERGKPTNREFLCRVAERLTLSMKRLL